MDLKKYQELCKKTAKQFDNKNEEIMCLGLGIAGEAGDVAGCIKKTMAHKDDQIQGTKENLGDTMWYLAMIANFYGWDLQEVLNENIEKLTKRYNGGGFNESDAAKRDRIDWNEEGLK